MPGIDLYAIYGLDRSQPPQVLAAALTDQLNRIDPRDPLMRNRIDTARAILGDPQRRAAYDAQLSDPSAPPVTEETLALIEGRSMPTASRPPLREQFASKQVRIVSAITAALALVLVVAVTAVACSGGSDDASTAASNSSSGNPPGSSGSECGALSNSTLEYAKWKSRPPTRTIFLDKRIDLPTEFDRYTAYTKNIGAPSEGLQQYQDRSIGVLVIGGDPRGDDLREFGNAPFADDTTTIAFVSPDGAVTGTRSFPAFGRVPTDLPATSDLANDPVYGYFSVAAADGSGITVPAAAAGNKPRMNYVLTALADAYDENAVWVLLRGSADLFKAHVAITQCLK